MTHHTVSTQPFLSVRVGKHSSFEKGWGSEKSECFFSGERGAQKVFASDICLGAYHDILVKKEFVK